VYIDALLPRRRMCNTLTEAPDILRHTSPGRFDRTLASV
jgi:hypothetical protein